MRLSTLQKFILKVCYYQDKKTNRKVLASFYANYKKPPKPKDQMDTITKSLERLIKKGLLTGYGVRTQEKWFIREVVLTPVGKKTTRGLFGKQQKLKI